MPATMASGSGLRLTIKTHAQAGKVTELTHGVLEIAARATSHRTLGPSMDSTEVDGLKRGNST